MERLHRRFSQRKICRSEGRLEEKERSPGVRCVVLFLRFDALGVFWVDRLLQKNFQRGIFLRKDELEGKGRSLAGGDY